MIVPSPFSLGGCVDKGMNVGVFFNALFNELEGYAVVVTFPGDGKYSKNSAPTENHWFYWPDQREEMILFVWSNTEKDIYTSPFLFHNTNNRRGENVKIGRTIYADADRAGPQLFEAMPTLSVETSPHRYQLYWIIDEEPEDYTPADLSDISRQIAAQHEGVGCDQSGWDLAQILRVPSTTNNKPTLDAPWTVRAHYYGDVWYFSTLRERYPRTAAVDTVVPLDVPESLPTLDEAWVYISSLPTIQELWESKWDKDSRRRSHVLWKLLGEMGRAGVPLEAAFVLAQHAGCNKYAQDGRSDRELWNQVCKAFADPDNQPLESHLPPEEQQLFQELTGTFYDESAPEREEEEERTRSGFLTIEERINLPKDTIVDQYLEWVMEKTDAAEQYHVAGILTVLSLVFAEFGYPATKFPLGPLNLWFIILGETTRTRKTTARKFALDTMRKLENESYQYELGSDVTAEGITIQLGEREGRSALVYRDEVHGLFSETKSKHYLTGLLETLTDLYDGFVRPRVRATGNQRTRSTRTSLSLHFQGTPEEVTTQLTTKDFQSGHLARFLPVYASPVARTPENVYMEQMEGESASQEIDLRHDDLVNNISQARAFWESITPPGQPVPIKFKHDAWERINKLNWDVSELAASHELAKLLEPAADRMVKSVVKVSCLLAMQECKLEVEMRHVMKAAFFFEGWFGWLEMLGREVRANQWERDLDMVREALNQFGHAVTWQKLYRKLHNRYRPKEFEELVHALVSNGSLEIKFHNGTKIVEKTDNY